MAFAASLLGAQAENSGKQNNGNGNSGKPRQVLAIAEEGTQHQSFVDAALEWLDSNAKRLDISVTRAKDMRNVGKGELKKYSLILQLDYPPYAWSKAAAADFERYIDQGQGGYVGFHHASLLGDIFGAGEMWQWFSSFMGGVRWKDYIAKTADATVRVEDAAHPVMRGVPSTFKIEREEWYTYDRSPRPGVRVLANVDEESYSPGSNIKMGDHPVVWVNESKKARNVYFQMGHHGALFADKAFRTMFGNAVRWALGDSIDAPAKPEADPYAADYAKAPRFRALLLWDPKAEEAHVQFDKDAIRFFKKLTYGEGFILDTTDDFAPYADSLSRYDVIIMCNAQPRGDRQREAFRRYMEQGGGWLGFHAAGYNDRHTNYWPWLNTFLGCGFFYCNNWPPQPALLDIDDPGHDITRSLPQHFTAPASEFYQWKPSPRTNKDVKVLVSISPKMYPFGLKDVVKWGDFPVAWTNTRYRMVYLNMGHGDEGFTDATQNLMFVNAFRWVVSRSKSGNPFVNKE